MLTHWANPTFGGSTPDGVENAGDEKEQPKQHFDCSRAGLSELRDVEAAAVGAILLYFAGHGRWSRRPERCRNPQPPNHNYNKSYGSGHVFLALEQNDFVIFKVSYHFK